MPFDGKMHKVLIHIDRNGYVYVIDRTYRHRCCPPIRTDRSTPARGIDLKTGRPIINQKSRPRSGETVRNICPTASGAKDWNPSSFSPQTGLLYIPHENMCMDWKDVQVNYIAGTPYVGAQVHMKPGPGGNRGELTAWDPVAAGPCGSQGELSHLVGHASVTAGDLVFYGTMDGWFKAVERTHRRAAVAIQSRQRNHRPADQLSRAGRSSVHRGSLGRRRLVGRRRLGPGRSARRLCRTRHGQCDVGLAQVHDGWRNALCVLAPALIELRFEPRCHRCCWACSCSAAWPRHATGDAGAAADHGSASSIRHSIRESITVS